MENEIMETVAEETTKVLETAEELVKTSKKLNIGKLVFDLGVGGLAIYGTYKAVEGIIDLCKAKKAAKEVDELEVPGKIDEFDDVE